jgi:large subunit ribosomal protein L30
MAQLKITWLKSCIGRPGNQRKIIRSLGLRRLHQSVILGDTATIRGMVNKVSHLLKVEELESAG